MATVAIKKKRVSKRSKLSWRKYVNINDVEEFLEDQRLDERLGPPLETLSDEALFKVDTKPTSQQEVLSSKQRKRLKLIKPVRCFSVLEPHTKVPDPIQRRNRVRSKEERKNELIKKKEAKNRANGILKHRELQAIRDHQNNATKKETQPKRGDFFQNIWDNDSALHGKNEWFSKPTIKHNLSGGGQSRKTIKKSRQNTSILPKIEAPHPGMSYNPSFTDHQDLLKVIAEKESKVIKEEAHLDRVTKHMFCKVTEAKRDSAWLQEMSQGLPNPADNDESDSDGEYKSVNPPTVTKKKTLQQRRKQREQMRSDLLRKVAKVAKKKVSDIHQLKLLKKQMDENEAKARVLREKRANVKLLKQKEPKRLSAVKFEETELDFNMGPDISGNLRNLKKEGNLLRDRFKSLQKRNVIQPSIRRHRKKAKVKVYTKPGHKEDWVTTVATTIKK